jgi:hypothetical protein
MPSSFEGTGSGAGAGGAGEHAPTKSAISTQADLTIVDLSIFDCRFLVDYRSLIDDLSGD